jgi:DNA repair protein RadC
MKTASYNLILPDLVLDEGQLQAKEYILKIKDMPEADKPREKMLASGPEALSVSELIAVILNTGTKKEDVMSMASRILKDYGERTLSMHKDPAKLANDFDIPIVKATQIVACAELGRRFFAKPAHGLATIRNARDVWNFLHDMRTLPKEHLRGIYLNTHHRVIHIETISIGTINTNIVHPREVFKPAIEHGAVAVILAHNHPSGVTTPSQADIEITKHLAEAGKLIGIPLVDHVIIGKTKFTSIDIPSGS